MTNSLLDVRIGVILKLTEVAFRRNWDRSPVPLRKTRYARAAQLLFGRLGLLVDRRFGNFREGLVRGLFFGQRFLK
jgi:hypothetical protein